MPSGTFPFQKVSGPSLKVHTPCNQFSSLPTTPAIAGRMSTPRKPRHSRKNDIPRDLILNWQSSRGRGARPLVRRPLTACEPCRGAKVRCDRAQPGCGRCRDRGTDCKYTTLFRADKSESTPAALPFTPPVTSAQLSASTPPTLTGARSASPQVVPEDILMDLGVDSAHQLDFNFVEYEQASERWSDWTSGVALSGPGQLDWLSTNMCSLDVRVFPGLLWYFFSS